MIFVKDEDDDEIDDVDDLIEDFCEIDAAEHDAFFDVYTDLGDFRTDIIDICSIEDHDEREDAIDLFVATNFPEEDDDADDESDRREKVLVCHKDKKTLSIAPSAVPAHLAHGDYEGHCDSDVARADYMHDKYSNKGTGNLRDHFAEYCDMTPEERAEKIDAKHDDLPDDLREELMRYCEMTEDEQDDFRDTLMDTMDEYHDAMKDISDKKHDKKTDKLHEKMMKFSDMSPRLKEMIKSKHDISEERYDEIRMKYEERHGDVDKKKSELKMKFKEHMAEMKFKISDERRSQIHDRLAEMKAFKADLRERASTLTDEEKQQLRENFIEKAKDMQLAWISPRTQMTAGVEPAEVECREGYSLVMKASNGVAICLKADSALKMIDRGIVVPAN